MIEHIAKMAVAYLEKHDALCKEQYDAYLYGANLFIYTVTSTIGLLLIGSLMGKLLDAVIIVALFYLNQTVGGGYHATSHLKCFLVMAVGLTISLTSIDSLYRYGGLNFYLVCISMTIMLIYPVVFHNNKAHLIGKRRKYVVRSWITSMIESILILYLLHAHFDGISISLCVGFAASAVSRLIGHCL